MFWPLPGRAFGVATLLLGGALVVPARAPAARASAEEPAAAEARTVLRELEKGQAAQALTRAEMAGRRFPQAPVLHLRLGQAHLARALDFDRRLDSAAQDAAWAGYLEDALDLLREPTPLLPGDLEIEAMNQRRDEADKTALLTPANVVMIARTQAAARRGIEETVPLLNRRSHAMRAALDDLAAARRLGEESTELELTELWALVVVYLWRSEVEALTPESALGAGGESAAGGPLQGREAILSKALAALPEQTADDLLRAAQGLARQRPGDPGALAGAADLITLVARVADRENAWDQGRNMLTRPWRLRHLLPPPSLSGPSYAPALAAYRKALAAKEPAADVDPWTVVLQLYLRAVVEDPRGRLPYLRPRAYLLRRAFEPAVASHLLEQIATQQPRSAFPSLERARAILLIEDQTGDGLANLQEAARQREVTRSCLVAVPPALRAGLRYQRTVRRQSDALSIRYNWVFGALREAEATSLDEASRSRFRSLRLRIADPLCRATDYPDQVLGIEEKARALASIAATSATIAEQEWIAGLRRQHARAFSAFPRSRDFTLLTPEGLLRRDTPNLDGQRPTYSGPNLILGPDTLFIGPPEPLVE